MKTLFLTQLPLTYADSFKFENCETGFQIRITNIEHQLVVLLKNVLGFSFSRDSLQPTEDWLELIEITHEYRKLTSLDLSKCSFSISNVNELPPLHIITLYGSATMDIICGEVELENSTAPAK
ncbi:hypothetical protein U2F10_11345 [Leptothoe sp. EHU-05/26/07-4]